jgi:Ca2+-binding RTX toxin-like protein
VFADARAQLLNKVEVARFYTQGLLSQSQDIAVLQQVLTGVDANASSVASAKLRLAQSGASTTPTQQLTTGNDTFFGSTGNDNVDGLIGNDVLDGGDGNDQLTGGIGNDNLKGGRGKDALLGGGGDDTLTAGAFADFVGDPAGTARYTFDAYSELLQGGDGADTLYGGYGADVLDGGAGADVIYGDYSTYSAQFATSDQLKLMLNDVILGGEGADTIEGGEGVDWIEAGTGADRATLGSGGGHLEGGDGDDRLWGSRGNDDIQGQVGIDWIYINQNGGNDKASGGDGNDTIDATYRSAGTFNISGDAGSDLVYLQYGTASGLINLGEGADFLLMGNGQYAIDLTEATAAKDEIDVSSVTSGSPVSVSTVSGFDKGIDVVDVGYFNLWGTTSSTGVTSGYTAGSSVIIRTFVQHLNSPSTPLLGPTGASASAYVNGQIVYNQDFAGKGIFIITGASAAAADTATVSNFINPYGNNATYAIGQSHYFVVDVAGQGAGLYQFKDDTNGDSNVIADELTPILLLTGVSAASLKDTNFI